MLQQIWRVASGSMLIMIYGGKFYDAQKERWLGNLFTFEKHTRTPLPNNEFSQNSVTLSVESLIQ